MSKNHPLIESWEQDKTTLNGWMSTSSAFNAEIMANCGFDSISIDTQHGINDYLTSVDMLRAINQNKIPSLIRVPWLDPTHIMKTLDAGVSGIICPMINTKKGAQELVKHAYYPPLGERSFGPARAKFVYGNDYVKNANNSLLVFAMIETRQALENLDDILSVEGIDGVYIGPTDLSFSLGLTPQFDSEEKIVLQAIGKIILAVKKYKKYAGIHNGSVDYAFKMSKLGFNFVTVSSDALFILNGAKEVAHKFKSCICNDDKSDEIIEIDKNTSY